MRKDGETEQGQKSHLVFRIHALRKHLSLRYQRNYSIVKAFICLLFTPTRFGHCCDHLQWVTEINIFTRVHFPWYLNDYLVVAFRKFANALKTIKFRKHVATYRFEPYFYSKHGALFCSLASCLHS